MGGGGGGGGGISMNRKEGARGEPSSKWRGSEGGEKQSSTGISCGICWNFTQIVLGNYLACLLLELAFKARD